MRRCSVRVQGEQPEPPGENQLDFFRKLGYSAGQVRAVMQKFGTDTDRVLGELVRTKASQEAREGAVTTVSVPVSKGVTAAKAPNVFMRVLSPEIPADSREGAGALRPIVIDGSNVAMSHGNKEFFSCLGIQLAVNFFLERGHSDITVFVPSWRKEAPRPDVPISDQHILRELERKKILVFTPSRRVAGKRVVCYDDRFIVKLAYELAGVIVSNDTYRDLQGENPEWKRFVEESLLMYFFVNDKLMVPDDPLGRHGPTLENFLRRVPKTVKKQPCPYGRKCTYGIKCKFHHPERGHPSKLTLADELREKVKISSSPQNPPSVSSGPGWSRCPSLEEEMSRTLAQQQQQNSGALRRAHTSENVPVKGGHHIYRRHSSRKEKASQCSSCGEEPLTSGGSPERLDSGLGSIESQTTEALGEHSGRQHGESCERSQPAPCGRQQYYRCDALASSCCRHSSPSLAPSAALQRHSAHHSMGPSGVHERDAIPYSPAPYYGYGAPVYLINMHAHSHTADFLNRRTYESLDTPFWSDPFGVPPPVPYHTPRERSPWGYPQGTQVNPHLKEREDVRKKLLAIFNVGLVDRAMDTFPQVTDPQVLAAEIIMLQSQDRAGR